MREESVSNRSLAARCRQMAENSNDEATRKFWLAYEQRWLGLSAKDPDPEPIIVEI